jgi:ABC-type polysaccharide/polyol phosphate transport system ATPase subunit
MSTSEVRAGLSSGSRLGVAVRVENVSKHFKLYHNAVTGPVKELLFFWDRERHYRRHTAVRSASFEVRRGETVGIVGLNGSGKTTLLKMIAGLLPVDEGRVEVNGRVTALLALGVGVHPEMSGRDNVLYGGMLLGMRKAEVLRKMPEIVAFSELEEFIDHPFRTYSSGMKARLLFAISMAIDPDILIVDEALATGDAAFVEKSSRRVRELCRSGATIIFVSHNLRQVEDLCDRTIVMHRGVIVFDGETPTAIRRYIDSVHEDRGEEIGRRNALEAHSRVMRGTGELRITDLYFRVDGRRTETLIIGLPSELVIEYEADVDLPTVRTCVEVRTEKSVVTYAFLPPTGRLLRDESDIVFPVTRGRGRVTFRLAELTLGDGRYSCDVEFFSGAPDFRFSYDACYCYYQRAAGFQAIYRDHDLFGKGTLAEMRVESLQVESLDAPLASASTER